MKILDEVKLIDTNIVAFFKTHPEGFTFVLGILASEVIHFVLWIL